MRYRFIILTSLCASFGISPIFAIWPFSSSSENTQPKTQPEASPGAKVVQPVVVAPEPSPLKDPSDSSKKTKEDTGCSFVGAHAVADWLNAVNIGSFYGYASKNILRNNECFVTFNPSHNVAVWLEPYGFNARYRSPTKSRNVDLTLTSVGAGMGARYIVFDNFHLGGGAGYFHSNFDCEGDKADINGAFFGPSIEYLFTDGSLGFMVMAVRNFYEGKIKRSGKECDDISYSNHSWDIDARLEGEYDIHLPMELTLHPYFRFDYLAVFEDGYGKKEVKLQDKHSNLIYAKVAARLEKVLFCNTAGFLSTNFDIGWVNMTPLSSDAMEWKSNEEKGKTMDLTTKSKNQYVLGLELVGMYHKLLLGLGYQATIGANSPIQAGRARIEWNW